VQASTSGNFPVEPGGNHYYAARQTDANAVQAANGAETEKFLFYRGLADIPVPLQVRVVDDGGVTWSATASTRAPQHLVLFENRGGRLGYRRVDAPFRTQTIPRPELTASFDSLRAELTRLLTDEGLFPREAAAMVETWRDSWFEEGTRLFYVMPQDAVDAVLPMSIWPEPAHRVRVFVGRIEVVTPEVQLDVERAFAANDLGTLAKYARFLEPIAARIMPNASSGLNPARLKAVQAALAAAHKVPSCR